MADKLIVNRSGGIAIGAVVGDALGMPLGIPTTATSSEA